MTRGDFMRVTLCRRKYKYRRIAVMVTAVLLYGSGVVMKRLENAFYTQLECYANDLVSNNVEKAVNETFEKYGINSYISENNNGKVSAVSVDTVSMNKIKSTAAQRAQEELEKVSEHYVYVPLMSIADFPILNGMGIRIPIRIMPVSMLDTKYEESFISSGINQTRQKIDLIVTVDVCYSGFMLDKTETIDIQIPVVNTVINGDVPQYYGYLNSTYPSLK